MKKEPTREEGTVSNAELVRRVLRGRELIAKQIKKRARGHCLKPRGSFGAENIRADLVFCDSCYAARPMEEINKVCDGRPTSCHRGTMRPVAYFADDLEPKAVRDAMRRGADALSRATLVFVHEASVGVKPKPWPTPARTGFAALNAPGHTCHWCPSCEEVRDSARKASATAELEALRKANRWTMRLYTEGGNALAAVYCSGCGAGTTMSGREGEDCGAGHSSGCGGKYQTRLAFAVEPVPPSGEKAPYPIYSGKQWAHSFQGSRVRVTFDMNNDHHQSLPHGAAQVNALRRKNGYDDANDAPKYGHYCGVCARYSRGTTGVKCRTKTCRGFAVHVSNFAPGPPEKEAPAAKPPVYVPGTLEVNKLRRAKGLTSRGDAPAFGLYCSTCARACSELGKCLEHETCPGEATPTADFVGLDMAEDCKSGGAQLVPQSPGFAELITLREMNGHAGPLAFSLYCSRCGIGGALNALPGAVCRLPKCFGTYRRPVDFANLADFRPVPMVLTMELRACEACGNWNSPPEIPEVLHLELLGSEPMAVIERPCEACSVTVRTRVTARKDGASS